MGKAWFGREWFKKRMAPALRWWGKQDGPRPLTDQERVLREFEIDLEAVDSPEDLGLYWRAQPMSTIPRERRRVR